MWVEVPDVESHEYQAFLSDGSELSLSVNPAGWVTMTTLSEKKDLTRLRRLLERSPESRSLASTTEDLEMVIQQLLDLGP